VKRESSFDLDIRMNSQPATSLGAAAAQPLNQSQRYQELKRKFESASKAQ